MKIFYDKIIYGEIIYFHIYKYFFMLHACFEL